MRQSSKDICNHWHAPLVNAKLHIRELDGVRGLAVLMVLIWHYVNCQGAAQLGLPIAYLARATGLFWSGVDLFFVLSGFLIGGIVIENAAEGGFYRAFYVRRVARILPVYVLLLSLYFVCRSTLDQQSFGWLFDNSIPDISYLTFTQNIFMGLSGTFGGNFLGITWSLAIEEQFYFVVPLLIMLVGPARFLPVAFALMFLAPFLRLTVPGFSSVVNMPFRMDALLVGVALVFHALYK